MDDPSRWVNYTDISGKLPIHLDRSHRREISILHAGLDYFTMGVMERSPGGSIEERILQRLTDAENKENIILDLCEAENLDWSEARAMVDAIEVRKKNQIVLAQSPVLVMIALGTFIGGLALLGYALYNIAVAYDTYTSAQGSESVGFILYLIAYGGYFWEFAILGLAMVVGSLTGMQDVWRAVFEKIGLFQSPLE